MPTSYRAAQTMIKRGDEDALANALATGLDANAANANGWTLLMLAAVEGSEPLTRLLLHYGAQPAASNGKGETAQSIAEARGHTAVVGLLTEGAASTAAATDQPTAAR